MRYQLHPVSGAHHAHYERGGGFCTFCYLVGSARALARRGVGPVGIVDLDAHPGDGTYTLAKDDPGIVLFDIAGGAWVTVGPDDRHQFFDVDDVDAYRAALEKLPAFLDRTRPGLVEYQAGMDPYYADPVGGIPGVDAAFLRFRDQFVIGHLVHRGIPVVVNLAGGYLEDGISEQFHLETIRVAVEAQRRHRTREMCSFDPETGTLTDVALHAELLGDDTAEWDLNLTPCENLSDEEIDRHLENHIKRHYGDNAGLKPDSK